MAAAVGNSTANATYLSFLGKVLTDYCVHFKINDIEFTVFHRTVEAAKGFKIDCMTMKPVNLITVAPLYSAGELTIQAVNFIALQKITAGKGSSITATSSVHCFDNETWNYPIAAPTIKLYPAMDDDSLALIGNLFIEICQGIEEANKGANITALKLPTKAFLTLSLLKQRITNPNAPLESVTPAFSDLDFYRNPTDSVSAVASAALPAANGTKTDDEKNNTNPKK